MDFAIPTALAEDIVGFKDFVKTYIKPNLPSWNQNRELPPAFFHRTGEGGWFGLKFKDGRLTRESVLMEALVAEELAIASPGVAIAALAHVDLGLMGLFLYGTRDHHQAYGASAVRGRTLMCLGNTENIAGSDVAGIAMTAEKVEGGWVLN